MQVASLQNFTSKKDIQIQNSTYKLGIVLDMVASPRNSNVNITVRYVSNETGTTTIHYPISITKLLERTAIKQGHFEYSRPYVAGVSPAQYADRNYYHVVGTIQIGADGALDLAGGYLSVDVEADSEIKLLNLFAIDAGVKTRSFLGTNPLSINGVTKEVSLAGIDGIMFAPAQVKNLTVQYPGRSSVFPHAEIQMMQQELNDLVSVDIMSQKAEYGHVEIVDFQPVGANSITFEPENENQFYVYKTFTGTLPGSGR